MAIVAAIAKLAPGLMSIVDGSGITPCRGAPDVAGVCASGVRGARVGHPHALNNIASAKEGASQMRFGIQVSNHRCHHGYCTTQRLDGPTSASTSHK